MGFAAKTMALSQKRKFHAFLINGVFIVVKVHYVQPPSKEVYGSIWSKSKSKIKSKSKGSKNEYGKSR